MLTAGGNDGNHSKDSYRQDGIHGEKGKDKCGVDVPCATWRVITSEDNEQLLWNKMVMVRTQQWVIEC